MEKKLQLHLLNETFTINKLPQFGEIPSIFTRGEMVFIARTDEELSVICPEFMAPNNVQQETGLRCIRLEGQYKLQDLGIIIAVLNPLQEANIPVLTISTFNTDYIFIMEDLLVNAVQALQQAGHEFVHKE
ncbi:MAG: ACT domain-containing protein [bacterium]